MPAPVVVTGMKNLPKKPVRWWGAAVFYMKDGSRAEANWNSRGPMTIEQAQLAMRAVVDQLVADIRKEQAFDDAVDAGYVMQCR